MAAGVDDGTTAAALVAIAEDFSAQADQFDPTLESTGVESSHRSTSGGTLSGGHAADDTG
jgi:hypothetical protein